MKNRLSLHNKGKVNSTKNFRLWNLIYYEAFLDKYDAFNREKELKTNYTSKRHLIQRISNSLKNRASPVGCSLRSTAEGEFA